MRAVIAKVDLSELPLPPDAKADERSAVTVRFNTPQPVEETMTFLRRELEKAGILGPYSRDEVYILDRPRFEEMVFQNE